MGVTLGSWLVLLITFGIAALLWRRERSVSG
jgi:hypothetical protein